jgi:excisionase family DNA binding protein
MGTAATRLPIAIRPGSGINRVLQTLESRDSALRARDLAKLLGVTRQHIYKMAAAGDIPFFRVGSAVRFDPGDVAGWLQRVCSRSSGNPIGL